MNKLFLLSTKPLLISVLIGSLLPGCASMDDQQTTVAQGAGVGALLGAGLGYAITGDRRGVLAGAAVGGLAGAAVGSTVADRKAQYANQEDFLVAEIQRNEDFIREADAENRQMYAEIEDLDRESRRLAQQYRAGKASRNTLIGQRNRLENQLAKAKKINSLAERQLADAKTVHQDSQRQRGAQDRYTRKLESNVVQLTETRQRSERNVANLQQMYDRLSI